MKYLILIITPFIVGCNIIEQLQNQSKKSDVLSKNFLIIWNKMNSKDCNDINVALMINHLKIWKDNQGTIREFIYYAQKGKKKLKCKDLNREENGDCITNSAKEISSGNDACIIGLDELW